MTTILIIDDDLEIRMILRKFLSTSGFQVVEAADGREGVRQFSNANIDLVITDILMPEKDGLAVIREIHAMDPQMRIIALSGGGMTLSAETSLYVAKKMGAVRSLAKPFTRDELLDLVNIVLESPVE